MSKFVLTAQLKLQAPKNTNQVINQIQNQLQGIQVPLEVKGADALQKNLQGIDKQTSNLDKRFKSLGKTIGRAAVRFAAFAAAGRALSLVTNTLSNAVNEAISFERELIKISQVTGVAINQLQGLQKTITKLSTSFGVSSTEILGVGRILSQAGIAAKDLDVALTALAKTQLAPTFTDINKTAEGSIAILRQFGQGVRNLERDLGAVNAVAGQFAVESDDLIDAVRRVGGVFKNAGGDLNELIGLFTSVRATTRESAESIATGLRTIFTRIQRPKTIEFLEQYGVKLTDLEGKFVGPFEAVRRLSTALKGLEEGDLNFIKIAEELGGFRQIGKVIPLIREFETAEKARQAAIAGGSSLNRDAITAQLALAVQIQKTKEEFLAFVREVTATDTFQFLVRGALDLASAFIKVADAVKPLLPLVAALGAAKLFKVGVGAFKGIGSAIRGAGSFDPQNKNLGGPIRGFNSGGLVPGTGNRDTVPAMLTPGEFVIRRSSVQKLGASNLAKANNYAAGGQVNIDPNNKNLFALVRTEDDIKDPTDVTPSPLPLLSSDGPKAIVKQLEDSGVKRRDLEGINLGFNKPLPVVGFKRSETFTTAEQTIRDSYTDAANQLEKAVPTKKGGSQFSTQADRQKNSLNIALGNLFENFVTSTIGSANPGSDNFDIRKSPSKLAKLTNQAVTSGSTGDIKLNDTPEGLRTLIKKAANEGYYTSFIKRKVTENKKGRTKGKKANNRFFGGSIQHFNAGGIVNESKIGGAMLEEGSKSDSVSVGIKDIESEFAKYKNLAAGASPIGRYFNGKNFTLNRQGLDADTEAGFKTALFDGFAVGIDSATSNLSADLGLGSASLDQASKQNFLSGVRPAAIGDLFEGALRVLSNQGVFDSAEDPNRAFDFNSGLQGAVADNYDKLAGIKFIDAKSSFAAGTTANFKGKARQQIANELRAAGVEGEPIGKKAVLKKKGYKVPDLPGFPKRKGYATGGSAGGDTVPAMLTPGEFVVNAKSAQKIGYGALNRMNTRGVMGFNTGGQVPGVQYFKKGGGVKKGSDVAGSGIADTSNFTASVSEAVNDIKKFSAKLPTLRKRAEDLVKSWDEANAETIAATQAHSEMSARLAHGQITQEEFNVVNQNMIDAKRRQVKIATKMDKAIEDEIAVTDKLNEAKAKKEAGIKAGKEAKQAAKDSARKDNVGGGFSAVDNIAEDAKKKKREKKEKEKPAAQERNEEPTEDGTNKLIAFVLAAGAATAGLESLKTDAESTGRELTGFQEGMNNAVNATQSIIGSLTTFVTTVEVVNGALSAFGLNLNAKSLMNFAGFGGKAARANSIGRAAGAIRQKGTDIATKGVALQRTAGTGVIARSQRLRGKALTGAGLGARALAPAIAGVASAASTMAIAGVASFALAQAFDQLTGATQKTSKAIERGDIEGAEKAGEKDVGRQAANIAAGVGGAIGGLAGAFAGPVGIAVGAAIGATLGKLFGGIFASSDAKKLAGIRARNAASIQKHSETIEEIDKENKRLRDEAKSRGEKVDEQKQAANVTVAELEQLERFKQSEKDELATGQGRRAATAAGIRSGDIDLANIEEFKPFLRKQAELEGVSLDKVSAEGRARASDEFIDKDTAVLEKAKASGGGLFGIGGLFFAERAKGESAARDIFARRQEENLSATNYGLGVTLDEDGQKVVSGSTETSKLTDDQIERLKTAIDENAKIARERSKQSTVGAAFGGGSVDLLEDYNNRLQNALPLDRIAQLDPELKAYIEQQQNTTKSLKLEVDTRIKLAKNLNAGLKDVGSSADAAALRISSFAEEGETGFSRFGKAVKVLELASSDAANSLSDDELNSALSDASASLKQFGADNSQVDKVNSQFEDLVNLQRNYKKAIEESGEELGNRGTDSATIQEVITKNLLKNVKNKDLAQSLEQQLKKDLDGVEFEAGDEADVRKVLGPIQDLLKRNFEETSKVLQTRDLLEQQLVDLTQKRIVAEQEYIDAQKGAIDVIIESRKTQAEFGGAAFTAADQLKLEADRFNLDAQRAGVRGVGAGETQDIENVRAAIASSFNSLEQRRQEDRSAFQGVGGAEADKRNDLQNANKSLLEFTKTRISLLKEELDIVRKKNEAEKKSLESLFSGDIEGFLKQQEAIGAAAALETGSGAAARTFSPDALGRGFLNLQKAGIATQQAADATLQAYGINNAGLAAAAVGDGTGAEGESIKKEIVELAKTTEAIAQDRADFEKLKIDTAILDISRLEIKGQNAAAITERNEGRDYEMGVASTTDTADAVKRNVNVNSNGNNVNNEKVLARQGAMAQKKSSGQISGQGFSFGGGFGGLTAGAEGLTENLGQFNANINQLVTALQDNFKIFSEAVDRLNNTKLDINLADTVVKIDLVGTGLLNSISTNIKNELLSAVSNQLKKIKFRSDGSVTI